MFGLKTEKGRTIKVTKIEERENKGEIVVMGKPCELHNPCMSSTRA